jgi:hypothetical protein
MTRKPRSLRFGPWLFEAGDEMFVSTRVAHTGIGLHVSEVKRLIAWLTKFVEWAEAREGK